MSVSKMKKEELEQLSNKDITYMLIEEAEKPMNTAKLFKKIVKLLGLPESTFEEKIGDYYTSLATDKRFVLLDNGDWDLRNKHTSDKVRMVSDNDDDEEDDELPDEDEILDEEEEDDYTDDDDNPYDDSKEDLKDLVIIDEDDIEELEQ